MVEQADRDSRRPAYVYLECGYAEGGCSPTPSASASPSASATASASASASALATRSDPRYENILDAFFKPGTFKLVLPVPGIGPVCAVVLILIELIEYLHS